MEFHFGHEMGGAQVAAAMAQEAVALRDVPTGRPSRRGRRAWACRGERAGKALTWLDSIFYKQVMGKGR